MNEFQEEVYVEAFEDEMQKVALSPKVLISAARKANSKSRMFSDMANRVRSINGSVGKKTIKEYMRYNSSTPSVSSGNSYIFSAIKKLKKRSAPYVGMSRKKAQTPLREAFSRANETKKVTKDMFKNYNQGT